MATRSVFTTSAETFANFPQSILNEIVDEHQHASINQLRRYTTGAGRYGKNTRIASLRGVIDEVSPNVLLVSYNNVMKELRLYKAIAPTKKTQKQKTAIAAIFNPIEDAEMEVIIQDIVTNLKMAVKEFIQSSNVTRIHYKTLGNRIASATQLKLKDTIFPTGKVYQLIDSNIGTDIDVAFVFSDYSTAGQLLQTIVRDKISDYLKSKAIGSDGKLTPSLSAILDLGHSAAKVQISDDIEEYYANFPKLTQVLLDKVLSLALSSNASSLPVLEQTDLAEIAQDFLSFTTQAEFSISVSKEFSSGFLKEFIKIGGQVLRFENSIFNQERGQTLERAFPGGTSSVVLDKFKRYLKELHDSVATETQKELIKFLRSHIVILGRKAINQTGSPSLVGYIAASVLAELKGTATNSFKGADLVNKISIGSSSIVPKTIVKIKPKKAKLSPAPKVSFPKLRTPTGQFSSLVALQNILNQTLHAQIQANMGTGSSKNILNYRSGRLAESVKVESMSQSREGMITAFYSYMRNPYGTFSTGGAQESPATRDPKLLISKSIREIGATIVNNRMRAVLV